MVLIHTHTIQFTSLRYTCGVLRILSLYHRSSLTLIYMCIFSIKLYMFAQNFIAHPCYVLVRSGIACPKTKARSLKSCGPCNGLVRMSAIISSVGQCSISNVPSSKRCLTKKFTQSYVLCSVAVRFSIFN